MQPVKAFIEQDHEAHIKVHQAFMQDPLVTQLIGQNPQAQAIMQAAQAHIAEHIGFAYRRRLEMQLGVPLPPPNQKMSPELENQISPLLAQAAMQVQQQSNMEVQAQQAQQAAQDPIVQAQQKELQLKEQELQAKVQLEMAKIQAQKDIAMLDNQTKLQLQQQKDGAEGTRLGATMVKDYIFKEGERVHGGMAKQEDRAHASAEKDKERAFNAAQKARKPE